MEINVKQPKQFLTKASGFLKDYTHTLNPYMGCQYACSYCYLRKSPISLFSGKNWGEWVTVKNNVNHQFQNELQHAKRKGSVTIFMSSSTDPYQPLEKKYEITRTLLTSMASHPPNFLFIQTRSPLIQRDIDILKTYPGRFIVSMTIETDREDMVRYFTPQAPSIQSRLNALKKLRQAGIPTQVAVAPLLPCTTNFPEILAQYTDDVTIDDYFMGDGSNGRRTESLGMRHMYQALHLEDWYQPDAYQYVLKLMQSRFSKTHISVSVDGFKPTEF